MNDSVRDRWSRYIGAMGVDAVVKQSKANVLLSGMNGLGVEIAKNVLLSGVKNFFIHDNQKVQIEDLAGQFFLEESDLGKNRARACFDKLQQLNFYVKSECLTEEFGQEFEKITQKYQLDVVVLSGYSLQESVKINEECRKKNIKFILCDAKGPFSYLFNDFGPQFEVADKNGEEPAEVMIKNITCE